MVKELSVDPKILISSNVHVIAEVDHSNDIWDAISNHVVDEQSYQDVIDGAEACCVLDRAYRGALAHGMEAV